MKSHKEVICPFMSGPYAQPDSNHVLEVGPGIQHAMCVGPKCAAFETEVQFLESGNQAGRCRLIPGASVVLYEPG